MVDLPRDIYIGARIIGNYSALLGEVFADNLTSTLGTTGMTSIDETSLVDLTPTTDLILVTDGGFYSDRCFTALS